MTVTSLLLLLLAFVVVHASDSDFDPLWATMGSEGSSSSATAPALSEDEDPEMTLAPIDRGPPTSTTFQLVDNVHCNATVADKLYVIYNKNRALFDLCVTDAQYQIFPFLGTEPSAAQVKDMSSSIPCVAMFTGVLLADFPQCSISGFPLKAAAETLLKIHVDLVNGWAPPPSAERFQEMLSWRQSVNLASDAGLPCDSNSELHAEYEKNLDIVQSNYSIRMLSNYQIKYKLSSGSWYDADEDDYTIVDSDDDTIGTVSASDGSVGTVSADDDTVDTDFADDDIIDTISASDGASKVRDVKAVYVEKTSITEDNSAPVAYRVIPVLVSLLLSALFMTY